MNLIALRLGKDFDFEGIKVKQPKVVDYAYKDEDYINSLCLPFLITSQVIDDDDISHYKPLEMFFLKDKEGNYVLDKIFGASAIDILCNSISELTGEEVDFLENMEQIVIAKKVLLTVENFEVLRQGIKLIYGKEDIEIEHPPRNMSERQLDIWIKLQNGRKRNATDDVLTIADYINIANCSLNYIPIKDIEEMTLFQLFSVVKTILEIDSHDIALRYKTSYKFEIKDDVSHWSEKIKIRAKTLKK